MVSKDHYFRGQIGGEARKKIKQKSSVIHSIYQSTCIYVYTGIILPPLLIEMSLSLCFSNVNTLMNHLRKPLKCRLWDRKCGVCPESAHLCKLLRKKSAIWCSGTSCWDAMAYFYFSSVYHFSTKVKFFRVYQVSELTGELLHTCIASFHREMVTQ